MNLYQVISHYDGGYNTYDSFICVAKSKADAKTIHPSSKKESIIRRVDGVWLDTKTQKEKYPPYHSGWVEIENVPLLKVVKLGKASPKYKEAEVILSSFNAG